jgi:predicted component of type VI protein secretion system
MAKLQLSFQGKILSEIPLDKEHISIGRKPDNDIHIDNLAVSSHHAVIHTLFNQAFVEDLHSTNGTFLNGQRIEKQVLKEGDVLLIGKHELIYTSADSTAEAEEEDQFDRTVIIRSPFSGAPPAPAPAAPAPAPQPAAAAAKTNAKLVILSGPDTGKEFTFVKPVTTFGKKGTQVVAVSKQPDGYYLSHADGATTATVNGESLGSRSLLLKEYDLLEVAGIKMTFLLS